MPPYSQLAPISPMWFRTITQTTRQNVHRHTVHALAFQWPFFSFFSRDRKLIPIFAPLIRRFPHQKSKIFFSLERSSDLTDLTYMPRTYSNRCQWPVVLMTCVISKGKKLNKIYEPDEQKVNKCWKLLINACADLSKWGGGGGECDATLEMPTNYTCRCVSKIIKCRPTIFW